MGTGAPELAVSTSAALAGSNEIALSNVVGSNIMNILLILGLSSNIHPITVNLASVLDLAILTAVSIIVYIFAFKGKLGRAAGAVMTALYAADMVFAILR